MHRLPRALVLASLTAGCAQDFSLDTIEKEVPIRPEPPEFEPIIEEEILGQRIPPKMDILWVMDDSISMTGEQEEVAENAKVFTDIYADSGLDWHIGVVSTTIAFHGMLMEGAGYRWVDPSVPDPSSVFAEMATLGNGGASREQGRNAVYSAFTDPLAIEHNAGFFRDDARLSIIFVSDEDDKSRDTPTLDTFTAFLDSLKPEPGMVVVSGIVRIAEACPLNDEVGVDYLTLIERYGGTAHEICQQVWDPDARDGEGRWVANDDWSGVLRDLADIGAPLTKAFYLPRVPVPETLEVWVEDDGYAFDYAQSEQPCGDDPDTLRPGDRDYCYDPVGNAIVFHTVTPRADAKVHVTYEVRASQVTPRSR